MRWSSDWLGDLPALLKDELRAQTRKMPLDRVILYSFLWARLLHQSVLRLNNRLEFGNHEIASFGECSQSMEGRPSHDCFYLRVDLDQT